jgi:4-oxalocrotonate tautomerase
MPSVRITVLAPNLTPEQLHRLRQGATDLMTSTMRKPLEGTSVLVEQVEHGGWTIAGEPVGVAAQVEAIIGVGTNSANEKAKFMEEMMQLLRAVLGESLRSETYIVVLELAHDSYGRGGLTRAERDRRRQAA